MTKQNPPVVENPKGIGYRGFGLVFSKKLFVLYLAMLLGVAILGLRESDITAPSNLPVLTHEQRRAMDVKLFNELAVRTTEWEGRTRERRYALIQDMGNRGFEPAALALRLFDFAPGSWQMRFDKSAYRRLKALADAGDPSAQCLAFKAIRKWRIKADEGLVDRYIQQAAKNNHPACTTTVAVSYQHGDSPYTKDPKKFKEFFMKGAVLGDQIARLLLAQAYGYGEHGFPLDIGKARCWFSLAEELDTGEADVSDRLWWEKKARDRGLMSTVRTYDPSAFCE